MISFVQLMRMLPALGIGLVLASLPLHGQKMVPDAPVKNFLLPMFGEDGYKAWDLQGTEGRYLGPEELEVHKMTLRLFAEGDPVEPQTVIQSPLATIYPRESQASGPGVIFITERGGTFSIFGREWIWNGQTNTITIRSEARVTFRESIGNIIR